MSPISAGTAYVDVVADLRKFGDSLKRQMAAHASVFKRQTDQLSGNFTRSFDDMGRSVDDTTTEVSQFGDSSETSLANVGHSTDGLTSEMNKLGETVQQSNERSKRSFLSLLPSLGQTSTQFGQLGDAALNAQDRVAEAQERVTRSGIELQRAQLRLAAAQSSGAGDANTLASAQSRVDEAQLRVSRATREADSAQRRFNSSMDEGGRNSRFLGSSYNGLLPDIGQMNSSLSLLGRTLGILKWPAVAQGANLAAAGVSTLSAAAVGAVASLAPLVGLLGALPALMTSAAATVGTAALGFTGIGDALTAMGAQATASVPAVGGAAGAAADAGAQVAAAGRAVEAAQRGVAAANRTVQDSERSLADSQRQVMYAQEALTDAREDARQTLRDLRDEVEGNVLSEKQAELRVAQARARLREVQRDENATRLDVRQAALDVQQAEFDLGQTREDNRENQKALNEAEREGVSGSEQVINARRGVADAERGVTDAELNLADAHRGVTEAQRAVEEAQRAVTEAMDTGSTSVAGMSTEATALAEAMANLSPAGREFVRVLFDMKPKLDQLRATAQEGLLPGVGRSIQTLGKELFPILNEAVGETARKLGSLAERGADLVTSGPWKRDFETLLKGNSRLLENMGGIAFNLGDAFRHIAVAGQPLAFWLGRIAEKGSEAIAEFFGKARRSGDLAKFFKDTRETVELLVSILGNLGNVLVDVLGAGQNFGRWLLRQFDDLTEGWAEFTGSVEGQNALKQWFEDAKPVVIALGRLIGDIVKLFGDMATTKGLPKLLNQLRTELLPVIRDIFRTSSGKLIPAIVDLVTQFGKLFKVFGTEHGFMIDFVKSLTWILRVVTKLVETVPGLGSAMATLGTGMGIWSAIKFTGMITGLSRMSKLLGGTGAASVAGSAATATGKVSLLQRALSGLGGRGLVLGLNPVTAILAGFAAVLVKAKINYDNLQDKIKGRVGVIEKYGKESKQAGKSVDYLRQMEFASTRFGNERIDYVDRANEKYKQQTEALLDTKNAQKTYNQAMSRANKITSGQREKIAELIGTVGRLGGKFGEAKRKGLENVLAMGDQGRAIDILKEKIKSTPDLVGIKFAVDTTGMDDALRDFNSKIYGVGTRAAQQLNQAFLSHQKISSPSKVWIGYGKNLMASLSKGIDTSKDAKDKIKDIWGAIEKSIKGSVKDITEAVKGGMKEVKEKWAEGWEDVREKLGDVWTTIKRAIGEAFDDVKRIFDRAVEPLKRVWGDAWEAMRKKLGEVWTKVKEAVRGGIDAVVGFMTRLPGKIVRGIGNLSTLLFDKGKSLISGLVKGIAEGASEIGTTVGDALEDALDAVGNALDKLNPFGDGFGLTLGAQGGKAAQWANAAMEAVPGPQSASGYRYTYTTSGNLSLHADKQNPAQDISGANLLDVAKFLASNYGSNIRELIHTPLGYGIKDGVRVPLSFWGDTINDMHYGHVHVADKGGVFKGPGLVEIGPIKETIFQPAQKISELPQKDAFGSRIVDLIEKLPQRFAESWASMRVAFENAISRLIKALSALAPRKVDNIAKSLTQAFQVPGTQLDLAMAKGGLIKEEVFGVGRSGTSYSFGERGPETVLNDAQTKGLSVLASFFRELPGKLQGLGNRITQVFPPGFKGGDSSIKETVKTGFTKEFLKLVPLEVNRSAESLTQIFNAPSGSGPDLAKPLRLADTGGVFRGPGMVGIGGMRETVFQPAQKISALPQTQELVPHIVRLISELPEELGEVSSRATRVLIEKFSGRETVRISDLMRSLPEKLRDSWTEAFRAFANEVRGVGKNVGDAVKDAVKRRGRDAVKEATSKTAISKDAISKQGRDAVKDAVSKATISGRGRDAVKAATSVLTKVHLADQGGVFRGPGMVGIGGIKETIFQPAQKVSELPQSQDLVPQIVRLISDLPEKLGSVSSRATRATKALVDKINGADGEATTTDTVVSRLIGEFSRLISTETNRSTDSLTEMLRSSSLVTSEQVQGPGVVGTRGVAETVLQPVREVSKLFQAEQFVTRIVELIDTLPEKLGGSGEVLRSFAEKVKVVGVAVGDAVKVVSSGFAKELPKSAPSFGRGVGEGLGIEVNRSARTPTQMFRALSDAIPGKQVLTSSVRPGAITPSGKASLHSIEAPLNAVDIGGQNLLAVAQGAVAAFGHKAKEIIFTPLGFSIQEGRRVPPIAPGDHHDHVHLADRGGVFQGPGMVGIGGITETVFQPARKVSALPQTQEFIPRIVQLIGDLPEKLRDVSSEVTRVFVDKISHSRDSDTVRTVASELIKEFSNLISIEVRRSTNALTQILESSSLVTTSDHSKDVRFADKGGVFQGPGIVGIGGVTETVFQPARKVSELPETGQLVSRIAELISSLPERLGDLWSQAFRAFANEIRGVGGEVGDAVRVALSGLTREISNLIPRFRGSGNGGRGSGDGRGIEVNRSARTPTQMFQSLSEAVPGTQVVTSDRRPDAATSSGNASLHSIEPPWNAVDISGDNLLVMAQAAVTAFGGKAREIVYTPLGFSIKDGVRVAPIAPGDHHDHLHIADKGGVFQGPGVVGIGDIRETVFQPAQKVSELPKADNFIVRILAVGEVVKTSISELTKEVSRLVPRFRGSGEGRGIQVSDSARTPIQMFKALSDAVPGKQMITSGHRPEATTPSGDISLHSIDPPWNAVDIGGDNLLGTAKAAVAAFGGKAKEIVFTPLGFSIQDGVKVSPVAAADHYDHIHLADQGGIFRGPGMVRMGDINETVFQPARKVSELPSSSLKGLVIAGTLQTPFGPADIQGMIVEEIEEDRKFQNYRGRAY